MRSIIIVTLASLGLLAVYTEIAPIMGVYLFQGALVNQYIITFIPAGITAIIFPWRMKPQFEASEAERYRIAGVPVVTIGGAGLVVVMAIMSYLYLTIPALGVVGTPYAAFPILGLPIIAIVIYYGMRAYRKRQGIDLDMVFKEIPPE